QRGGREGQAGAEESRRDHGRVPMAGEEEEESNEARARCLPAARIAGTKGEERGYARCRSPAAVRSAFAPLDGAAAAIATVARALPDDAQRIARVDRSGRAERRRGIAIEDLVDDREPAARRRAARDREGESARRGHARGTAFERCRGETHERAADAQ